MYLNWRIQQSEARISQLENRVNQLEILLLGSTTASSSKSPPTTPRPSDIPTSAEISRKRGEVEEAKRVGDHDEKYYYAAQAWLRHWQEGRDAANAAYEDAWNK